MKKLLSVIAILIFLTLPSFTKAAPKIKVLPDISKACENVSSVGCFVENSQTIYISNCLKPEELKFVFFHEYGHYLIQGHWQEAVRLFGSEESAATGFWMYVYVPAGLSTEQIMFYTNLL